MTARNTTLAVVPCCIVFEGITLADGRTLAVELDKPRQRFAIVVETAGKIEIIAMHDDQSEAVEAARRLEEQLQTMERAPEGVTIQ